MPFTIVRQDITRMSVDVIADPIYRGGNCGDEETLRVSYLNSLKLAVENSCESIAFPVISGGLHVNPQKDALQIATETIRGFLMNHDLDVYLVVSDRETFTVSEDLLGDVGSYLDEHYVDEGLKRRRRSTFLELEHEKFAMADAVYEMPTYSKGLDAFLDELDEPFTETILRLIEKKGKSDVEVYRKANLDRRLFSKIRSNKSYRPSKRTVIALCIALELPLTETNDLLQRAGFALSRSHKFDVIIEFFITRGRYDIFEINEVLFTQDQEILGG